LKWDMGILLTKVTYGVWNPNELRATTSSGNILCLGSGLSNTRLFAGRPRHQRRTQKLKSPKSGLPIQPSPSKIRVWKTLLLVVHVSCMLWRIWNLHNVLTIYRMRTISCVKC
jgi:hypothetical protein